MTLPVFDGRELGTQLPQLRPGQRAILTGDAAHHAAKVRRLSAGEHFDLVDTKGLRLTCEVLSPENSEGEQTEKSSTSVLPFQVIVRTQEQHTRPRLGLIQALAKSGRDEQSVEAAVELGVDWVMPWAAERCIVQWKGKKAKNGAKKWANLLEAAAKQSRRSYWPNLLDLRSTEQLKEFIVQEKDTSLFIVLEATTTTGISAGVAEAKKCAEIETVYVIVGPEGGISETELLALKSAGAKLCRLGTTILRSSSAAPAALAAIAANLGLWDKDWETKQLLCAKENDG